jgi:hypothetical protein
MIRLRTAVRTMPAFWFAIPIAIFAGWYASLLYPSDGYAVGATAAGTGTLPFVGPFCAACAAWEGSRLRRAQLWNAPSVRSQATIALWSLLPTVLVGLLAVIVAISIELARLGAGLPDMRFVAMALLDLIAYSALGFAAGLLLPFAVAGPLAIVVAFVWLAFVPAIQPVWLRHLTGMFRDCCGLQEDLAPRALLASSIVDLGIIGAAALLVARSTVWRRVGGAVATLTVAVASGVLLVGGMTYAPAIPRDTTALECRTITDATVCTWPEHQARADEVADIVANVRAGWQLANIDAPSLFTEAHPTVVPADALSFRFVSWSSTRDDIVRALAAAMLPTWPDCPGGPTGVVALEYLEAWHAASGGMSPEGLRQHYDHAGDGINPDVLTVVEQLDAATPETRRAWVSRAEGQSQVCDEWPLDLAVHQ